MGGRRGRRQGLPGSPAAGLQEARFPKPRNLIGLQKDLPVEEMEKLLANLPASDEDVRQLAERRAEVVQAWLAEQGKVAMERVFLMPPGPAKAWGDGKGERSRADFSCAEAAASVQRRLARGARLWRRRRRTVRPRRARWPRRASTGWSRTRARRAGVGASRDWQRGQPSSLRLHSRPQTGSLPGWRSSIQLPMRQGGLAIRPAPGTRPGRSTRAQGQALAGEGLGCGASASPAGAWGCRGPGQVAGAGAGLGAKQASEGLAFVRADLLPVEAGIGDRSGAGTRCVRRIRSSGVSLGATLHTRSRAKSRASPRPDRPRRLPARGRAGGGTRSTRENRR